MYWNLVNNPHSKKKKGWWLRYSMWQQLLIAWLYISKRIDMRRNTISKQSIAYSNELQTCAILHFQLLKRLTLNVCCKSFLWTSMNVKKWLKFIYQCSKSSYSLLIKMTWKLHFNFHQLAPCQYFIILITYHQSLWQHHEF